MANLLQDLPARYKAIQHFQSFRTKYPIGSRQHEIADIAISLALNSTRDIDEFLERNLYRDACITMQRQTDRFVSMPMDEADLSSLSHSVGGYNDHLWDQDTPELLYDASQIRVEIIKSGIGEESLISQILDDLLSGKTAEQSAECLPISGSRVAQYRTKIREFTLELLHGGSRND